MRPAQARVAPSRPAGAPPGDLYLLFDSSEFHFDADEDSRPVADLIVPTATWEATANLRIMVGVESRPGHGDQALVAEVSEIASTHNCPPPREPGVAWSDGVTVKDIGPYLEVSIYFPGGDLDEFAGLLVTDDLEFRPEPSTRSEDELNAQFADVNGRTQISPSEVEAGSTCVLNGTYTVGRRGLAVDDEIIFLVPNNGWSPPQIREATGEGYLTIHNTGRALAEITDVFRPGQSRFSEYWRIHVAIRQEKMRAGDQITVVYGDRSRQGPGTIAPIVPQVLDERTPRQRETLLPPLTVVTDRLGIGRLTLTAKHRRHSMTVVAGEISKFLVIAPSHALVGLPHTVNVIGVDDFNNPASPPFRGAVRVEIEGSPDEPIFRETFAGSDSGSRSVTWIPKLAGTMIVKVDDTTGRTGASNPILCLSEPPSETVYWGDPHCFTQYSEGLANTAETLQFAKNVAFLDFCAATDAGNMMSRRQWARAQRDADRANVDGEFVSFVGYQWSDAPGPGEQRQVGARTIVTSAASLPLRKGYRPGNSLAEVLDEISSSDRNAVVFANHPILDASWEQHTGGEESAVEIYSSYGSSERRGDGPSMHLEGSGISVDEILATGSRVTFLGCSAGYEGSPGLSSEEHNVRSLHPWRPFRGGLTAVVADDLTREALMKAIKRGRTYVTTGHRTIIDFHMNNATIGDDIEMPLSERRNFHVSVTSECDIRRVEIIRNGEPVISQSAVSTQHVINWEDRARKDPVDYYYLRVSCWDGGMAWTSPIWVRTPGRATGRPSPSTSSTSKLRPSVERRQ